MNPILVISQGRLAGQGAAVGVTLVCGGFDLGSVQHSSLQPGRAVLPTEQALYSHKDKRQYCDFVCSLPINVLGV